MPKTAMKQVFELTTRNQYTKCEAEISFTVEGTELPNMQLLGQLVEEAIEQIQFKVTQSYKTVPERTVLASAPTSETT